jgi:MFS transporter, YQGE family, putative transporter
VVALNNFYQHKIKRLLLSHSLFLVGRSAFEIFMNVFIWRMTNDIKTIAIFNLVYVSIHTLMFPIFSEALRKGKMHLVRKTGLVLFSLVFLSLFIFNQQIKDYIFWYGFFIGVANGMYWLPYHFNRFDLTGIKNRGKYTGYERSLKTFVSLVTPALGGFIISSQFFFSGYPTLFLAGTGFFLTSFFIGNIDSEQRHLPSIKWYQSVRHVLSHKKVRKIFLASMLNGFSLNGSLIKMVLPILILQKTGTEFSLGSWLSFFALLSMLASIFTGKVVHYKKYDRLVVVGGVAFLTLFGLLYFFPSLAIFILFGAVQEIAANMINIPRRVYSDNLIHHVKDYKEHRLGYIVSREFFAVGIGMFSSYVLLLFSNELSFTQLSLYSLLIATAVIIQIGLLISIKYSQTDLNG